MIYLNIDGLELINEEVNEFKITYNKIDGEGTKRNLQGNMRRQVVANKVKINVIIPLTSQKKMTDILKRITKDTASVTFLDPKTNNKKTIKAYFGAPEVKAYDVILRDGQLMTRYDKLSFSIIEL